MFCAPTGPGAARVGALPFAPFIRWSLWILLAGGSHHALPLLEQRGLQTVARTQGVRLVPRHQLLHRLEDDAQAQIVEGGVGDASPRDVLGDLI